MKSRWNFITLLDFAEPQYNYEKIDEEINIFENEIDIRAESIKNQIDELV